MRTPRARRRRTSLGDTAQVPSDRDPTHQHGGNRLIYLTPPQPSAGGYPAELAGLSDEAIFAAWLGADQPGIDRLVQERIARYRARVSDGATVSAEVRSAVRYAAERVPVGIVSGAARDEIEPVIGAAGLRDAIAFVVSADDVAAGKPDAEGYRLALSLLGRDVAAAEVLSIEDTEAGVAAAKAAGMWVIGLTKHAGP